MLVERKVIPRDVDYYNGAIERINHNIDICQNRYQHTELVKTYEDLRMDYIKKLASFYNGNEPLNFVADNDLAEVLLTREFIIQVSITDGRLKAKLKTDDMPYYWAKIYHITGREFHIEGDKVFFYNPITTINEKLES